MLTFLLLLLLLASTGVAFRYDPEYPSHGFVRRNIMPNLSLTRSVLDGVPFIPYVVFKEPPQEPFLPFDGFTAGYLPNLQYLGYFRHKFEGPQIPEPGVGLHNDHNVYKVKPPLPEPFLPDDGATSGLPQHLIDSGYLKFKAPQRHIIPESGVHNDHKVSKVKAPLPEPFLPDDGRSTSELLPNGESTNGFLQHLIDSGYFTHTFKGPRRHIIQESGVHNDHKVSKVKAPLPEPFLPDDGRSTSELLPNGESTNGFLQHLIDSGYFTHTFKGPRRHIIPESGVHNDEHEEAQIDHVPIVHKVQDVHHQASEVKAPPQYILHVQDVHKENHIHHVPIVHHVQQIHHVQDVHHVQHVHHDVQQLPAVHYIVGSHPHVTEVLTEIAKSSVEPGEHIVHIKKYTLVGNGHDEGTD